jgi:hypothetical protein
MQVNTYSLAITAFFVSYFSIIGFSQNKYGQTVLCGYNGMVAVFNDTSRPTIRKTMNGSQIAMFRNECSNICDSINGKPLFFCNGEIIYDTVGNIMDNGSYLLDSLVYSASNFEPMVCTQGSLILPKGNNQYYVFATTLSDSMFQSCWFNPNCSNGYYDELRYHIVDMNMNGGAGKVVVKNQKLLNHVPLNRCQMMACQHANGKDWWLLKTGLDTNLIYTFKVTQDSIYAPQVQTISSTYRGDPDHVGQIAFGRNGTLYAAVLGLNKNLMLADFDRCTGLLSNERYYPIPIDSTTILNQPYGPYDSLSTGVCFSPNGQFIYISKRYNVYQFEYDEEDSILAWYRLKHGPDTTWAYNYYGQLANAPDGRIYVGKFGGSYPTVSNVIDHPNIKGVGSGWCNRCFRDSVGTNNYLSISFANMPDYNLGPTNNPNCWPVASSQLELDSKELEVYPNPATSEITLNYNLMLDGIFRIYNHLGVEVFQTKLPTGNGKSKIVLPSALTSGLYFYKASFNGKGNDVIGKLTINR